MGTSISAASSALFFFRFGGGISDARTPRSVAVRVL